MALQLNQEFETPQGITVPSTYWRWVGLGIDVPSAKCRGVLYAYASAAAFASGKQPVGQREYVVEGQDFGALVMAPPVGPTLSDVLSNAMYGHVTATDPYFAEAVQAN